MPMNDGELDVRYVTNSELTQFKDCRRKWWLSNYRKLTPKRKTTTGPLPLGSRVHGALEVLYASGADPIAEYDRLGLIDMDLWAEQYAELGIDPTEEDKKKYVSQMELGHIMVSGYVEWLVETGEDAGITVIGAEEKVDVAFMTIRGKVVRLMGKLDMRIRRDRDGARLFIDHKTVGTSIQQKLSTMQLDEQFLHYQLLERLKGLQSAEFLTQGSMVNLLRKVKRTARAEPPFYVRAEIHHNDTELRNYWWRLTGEITDMLELEERLDSGIDHHTVAYPRPSGDCNWKCQFRQVCPMFDDGSDAERYLEDHFESYDPLTRYAQKEEEDE